MHRYYILSGYFFAHVGFCVIALGIVPCAVRVLLGAAFIVVVRFAGIPARVLVGLSRLPVHELVFSTGSIIYREIRIRASIKAGSIGFKAGVSIIILF